MAQGKITKEQLAEKDVMKNIKDSADLAESSVKSLESTMLAVKELAKTIKSGANGSEPNNNASIKERNKLLREANALAKLKVKTENELKRARLSELKLQKDRERAFDNFEKKEKAEAKRKATEAAKAEKRHQIERRQLADQNNAYKRLTKTVNTAQDRFKRLAVQYGENDKRTQKALITFRKLDNQLRRINNTARDGRRDVGRYGLAFNSLGTSLKSLVVGGGVVGVIMGIGRAFSDAAKTVAEFDESVVNIAKVTGLAKSEASDLAKEILRIDTRTAVTELLNLATAGGRLGLTGSKLIDFTKSADKAFVALGDSLEGTAEDIAVSLGKISANFGIEQEFGIGAAIEKVGSSMNELGANSKANEGRILDFTNRLAGIAPAANLALPEVQALGAFFDEAGQSIEVSATTITKLLPAIGKDTARFAKVAGMDIGKFEKLVSEKPLEALKAVAKGAKNSTKGLKGLSKTLQNYGIDAARSASIVGLLSSKTERLTELQELANDAFEKGTSLSNEFSLKNETLSASTEQMSKSWDQFIVSVDSGGGVISRIFKRAVDSVDVFINKLRQLNQSYGENLTENLSKTNASFISNLEGQIKDTIDLRRKGVDKEIEILESRNNRGVISDKQFLQQKKKLNEDFDLSSEDARNKELLKQKKFLEDTIIQQTKGTEITIDNAEKELERLDKISKNKIRRISSRDVNFSLNEKAREEQKIALEQKSVANSVVINKDRIRLIELLLAEKDKVLDKEEEEVEAIISGGEKKKKVVKEITGLINIQSKAVSDLNKRIAEATDEESIVKLGFELDVEKDELNRLKRLYTSTIEEIIKIEDDLIEDQTQRRITQEIRKAEKIIKAIESNNKISKSREVELAREVEIARDKAIEDLQLKQAIDKQKRDAEFAREEIKQRRSGFKTEEDFEKFKAEEFKAIKKKQLQEELELLEAYGREEDKLRVEQVKSEIEGLHKFEEAAVRSYENLEKAIQFMEDVIIRSIDARIDKLNEEEQAHRDSYKSFDQAARQGSITAKESLAEEKILADKAKADAIKAEKDKQSVLLVTAVLKSFVQELENPENNGNSFKAFGKAVLSAGAVEQFASALPTFIEGTENVGQSLGSPQLSGEDGYIVRVDGAERILNPSENKRIGNFSNEEVARTMEQKRMGNLMSDTQIIAHSNGVDLSGVEAELREVKKAIIDKPESNTGIEEITQHSFMIVNQKKKGNITTYNRFKVKA